MWVDREAEWHLVLHPETGPMPTRCEAWTLHRCGRHHAALLLARGHSSSQRECHVCTGRTPSECHVCEANATQKNTPQSFHKHFVSNPKRSEYERYAPPRDMCAHVLAQSHNHTITLPCACAECTGHCGSEPQRRLLQCVSPARQPLNSVLVRIIN